MYQVEKHQWKGHTGAVYAGVRVHPKDAQVFESRYTFESRYEGSFTAFRREGGNYYLPRNLAPTWSEDKRCDGYPITVGDNFVAKTPEQAMVVEESVRRLHDGHSFIVQAPTGFGKTFVGAALIARMRVSTLIVVTKADVRDQWVTALRAVLGLPADKIGFIQGDDASFGNPVAVGMLQSLHKYGRYPEKVYRQFGLVIVDEVHLMGADKFQQAMFSIPARLRVGLSATPYRKDGRDIIFHGHIGRPEVKAKQIPMKPRIRVVTTEWTRPMVQRYGQWEPLDIKPGRVNVALKYMAKDGHRNAVIIACAKKAADKQRNTIIFSATVKHLQILRDALVENGIPGADIAYYVGGLSKKNRELALGKPVILATYAMAQYGTDAPWLDCMIMASPRGDVAQIVGRVCREYADKPTPVVFDIVDKRVRVLANMAKNRIRYYRRCGYEVRGV